MLEWNYLSFPQGNIKNVWFHGTSLENARAITARGFTPSAGLFGQAVYLTSSVRAAMLFGKCVLVVTVDDAKIHHVFFEDWTVQYTPNESLWEVMATLGYDAVAIHYVGGETELIIYNTHLIREL